jgi:hypothetical protein
MTINESLQKAIADLQGAVSELALRTDAIPDLIRQIVKQISEAPVGTGQVTDAEIIAAIQTVTQSTKSIDVQGDVIPQYFENQLTHGDPEWPNSLPPPVIGTPEK